MDKYFSDKGGRAEEHIEGSRNSNQVHFPLCLAIQYEDNVPLNCPDFLLNISKGIMFVQPPSLFPIDTKLKLHFYIPPEAKLLAEFNGKVIGERRIDNATGNLIKIKDFFHNKLHLLEDYLEEKNHLVDKKI